MNTKKWDKKFIIFLILLVAAFIIYQFPIQKNMAFQAFDEYIGEQGVDRANIARRETKKDWGGYDYAIRVEYSDDTSYEYHYNYKVRRSRNRKNKENKSSHIHLVVLDKNNSTVVEAPYEGKCKYPPLEWDNLTEDK